MLEILETYLRTSVSPETADSITVACELFETYELPGYQDAYTDLLLCADNNDISDLTTEVVNLTTELQLLVMDQMLLSVDRDISVQQGNLLLRALRQVESTDFNDEIIVLCDDADTDNSLCEILSIVSGKPVEDFYPIINSVDRCVLDRIKIICQQQNENSYSEYYDSERAHQLVDSLLKYRKFLNNKPLIIYDLLLNGKPLELPFEHYYNELWESIAALDSEEIAIQLFAAAIISYDARESLTELLTKTFSSIDKITPIVVAFENISIKFNTAITSGISLEKP